MQFSEGNLFEVLFGHSQHFKIPDFQRSYSWDKKMWAMLWIDVMNQYKLQSDLIERGLSESDIHAALSRSPKHYLGAIVTTTGNAMVPPPSDVLDGQQRLVTSSILYLALRDSILRQLGSGDSTSELQADTKSFFRSAFFNNNGTERTKYRIFVQDLDRTAWEYLLSNQRPLGIVRQSHFETQAGHSDRIIQAFNFFYREINRVLLDIDRSRELEFASDLFPLNLDILKNVIETRLSIVRLMCGVDDDVNAIFESLNAKSEPLKQVDLIKNYIYISFQQDEASEIYREIWRPMESVLTAPRVERFVWTVVVSQGHPTLQKRTYETVRGLLAYRTPMEVRSWVEDLATEAKFYRAISDPATESDIEIREALVAIKRAGGSTMEPILLYVYRAWARNEISKTELVNCIKVAESFLVRRMIAGEKTQVLNSMVASMINKLYTDSGPYQATGNYFDDLCRVFSAERNAWPESGDVLEGVKYVNFYDAQKPEQRMHILRSIDEYLNDSGVFPNYDMSVKSMEHITPQTPSDNLVSHNLEITKRLHSLSNLTIVQPAINSSLGNKPWVEKKKIYKESPYCITSDLANRWGMNDQWGVEELDQRAANLLEIIEELWPKNYIEPHYIKDQPEHSVINEETDDFDPNLSEPVFVDD